MEERKGEKERSQTFKPWRRKRGGKRGEELFQLLKLRFSFNVEKKKEKGGERKDR